MPDFNVGDRVEATSCLHDETFWHPGVIVEADINHPSYYQRHKGVFVLFDDMNERYDCADGSWLFSYQEDIRRISPFTPGTRIRGYVEGVVSVGGAMVITDSVGDLPIANLSDVTVVKTLPTTTGSIITSTDMNENFVLFEDGYWRQLTNAFHHVDGSFFGDNWTLRFDAGAK